MDQKGGVSLIPKEYAGSAPPKKFDYVKLLMNVFSVFFFFSVMATGGFMVYDEYFIQKRIVELESRLAQLKSSSELQKDIGAIKKQDQKMVAMSELLKRHSYVTNLLDFIEKHTHQNVRFKSFDFKKMDGRVSISMDGQAKDVLSISKQIVAFSNTLLAIKNPEALNADIAQKEKELSEKIQKEIARNQSNEKVKNFLAKEISEYIMTAKTIGIEDAALKRYMLGTFLWSGAEADNELRKYLTNDTRATQVTVDGYKFDITSGLYAFNVRIDLTEEFLRQNFELN